MKFLKKIRLPKIIKKGSNPGGRAKNAAKKVFGFEKVDKGKFLKSNDLDEVEVITALTKLQTDMNWVKRIVWAAILGSGAAHYFG